MYIYIYIYILSWEAVENGCRRKATTSFLQTFARIPSAPRDFRRTGARTPYSSTPNPPTNITPINMARLKLSRKL